jgi:tetratricopeptide (TPR) repeat protein
MSADRGFFAEVQAARRSQQGCPSPALLLVRESDMLSDAARLALDAHTATCAACRRLRDDLLSLEPAELRADERARIDARVFAGTAAALPARPVSRIASGLAWSWRGVAAVAAALLVAALLPTSWWMPAPQPATPPPSPVVTLAALGRPSALRLDAPPIAISLETALTWRGAPAAAANPDVSDGINAFARGDFPAAYERLRRVPADAASADALLYLGVSALFLDRNDEAVAALARARSRSTAAQRSSIEWYASLADLRTGRPDEARGALVRLCQTDGDYSLRACAGLMELDRRAR